MNQNVPDDLLNDFNKAAREKFGDKKGCKRSALIEAIRDWLKKQNSPGKARESLESTPTALFKPAIHKAKK